MGRKKRQQPDPPAAIKAVPSATGGAPLTVTALSEQAAAAPTGERPLPSVSICTVTHNRQAFLPLLQTCIASQTYPHHLMEWVIVDDSDNGEARFQPDPDLDVRINHLVLAAPLILGHKRNVSHEHCSGEIIVYMDDDDYYPPQRVSHAVERLLDTGQLIAGVTLMPIYFIDTGQAWIAGPYRANHATANTFAFWRELLKQTRYDATATHAEEKAFLKNYELPMAQLDPAQTILCMGHSSNTFDKRKLIQGGNNPKMRKLADMPPDFISEATLSRYRQKHAFKAKIAAAAAMATPSLEASNRTISLDLGCGPTPRNPFRADYVCGVDIRESRTPSGETRVADLATEPIPWPGDFFDYITAFDFLEHVPRIIYCPKRRFAFVELMNEIWRCLKPGGLLLSSTPAYPHAEAFQDPTHVNIITERTFTHYFAGPLWGEMYGFKGRFAVVEQAWDTYLLKTTLRKI
jgi:SAM-dependent methyltransferase